MAQVQLSPQDVALLPQAPALEVRGLGEQPVIEAQPLSNITPQRLAQLAREVGLPPAALPLALATFDQETTSGTNVRDSPKGAKGPMQVIPATFQQYMPDGDPQNPEHLTKAGLLKLKDDFEFFKGDARLTAAAYHAGRKAVIDAGNKIPDTSDGHIKTADYVDQVLGKAKTQKDPRTTRQQWDEIAADPRTKELSDEDYDALRRGFFRKALVPLLDSDDYEHAWEVFDSKTARPGWTQRMLEGAKKLLAGAKEPSPTGEALRYTRQPASQPVAPTAQQPAPAAPAATPNASQPAPAQPAVEAPAQPAAGDEAAFQAWYADHAKRLGLNPNPDDPQHFYDYRAAFKAGAAPDPDGHWPSEFKREGHPNMVVDGVNTKTGQPAAPEDLLAELRARRDRAAVAKDTTFGVRDAEIERLEKWLSSLSPEQLQRELTREGADGDVLRSIAKGGGSWGKGIGAAAQKPQPTFTQRMGEATTSMGLMGLMGGRQRIKDDLISEYAERSPTAPVSRAEYERLQQANDLMSQKDRDELKARPDWLGSVFKRIEQDDAKTEQTIKEGGVPGKVADLGLAQGTGAGKRLKDRVERLKRENPEIKPEVAENIAKADIAYGMPTRNQGSVAPSEREPEAKGAERLWRDYQAGVVGSTGAMLGYSGRKIGFDSMADLGRAMDEWAEGKMPAEPTFADTLVNAIGSSASFFVPGLGVQKGVNALAILSPLAAKWAGAGAMSFLEAAAEADGIYQQRLKMGDNEKQAAEAADKSFTANMALLGITNKVAFFSDAKKLAPRVLGAGLTEGPLQEGPQQAIQNYLTDQPLFANVPVAIVIGTIVGTGMSAGHAALGRAGEQAASGQPGAERAPSVGDSSAATAAQPTEPTLGADPVDLGGQQEPFIAPAVEVEGADPEPGRTEPTMPAIRPAPPAQPERVEPTIRKQAAAPPEAPERLEPTLARAAETPAPDRAVPESPPRTEPTFHAPPTLQQIPSGEIVTQPEVFQFRSGADKKTGVVDNRLEGVEYDPVKAGTSIVYEREDGTKVIADGHHRLELAQEASAPISAFVYREADGWTPDEVRTLAATKNIAEGHGTPLDTAKVLRQVGEKGIKDLNLPPNSALVQQGEALSKLSDEVFDLTEKQALSTRAAVAIGETIAAPNEQMAAARVFQNAHPQSMEEARIIAQQIKAAGFATSAPEQGGLFGSELETDALITERARVLDKLGQALAQDARLFGMLERRAGKIEEAGNKLVRDVNQQKADQARLARERVLKLAFTEPKIKGALDKAAADYKRTPGRLSAIIEELKDILHGQEAQVRGDSTGGERVAAASPARQGVPGSRTRRAQQPAAPGPQASARTQSQSREVRPEPATAADLKAVQEANARSVATYASRLPALGHAGRLTKSTGTKHEATHEGGKWVVRPALPEMAPQAEGEKQEAKPLDDILSETQEFVEREKKPKRKAEAKPDEPAVERWEPIQDGEDYRIRKVRIEAPEDTDAAPRETVLETSEETFDSYRKAQKAADRRNESADTPRFSRSDTPIWYSQLARVIDQKGSTATPSEWRQRLEAWAKAGAFKRDELEWSGLLDWLELQSGKVTKDQVAAFVRENGVQVEEVELGGSQERLRRAEDAFVAQAVREHFTERGAREHALDVARDDLTKSQRELMSDEMRPLARELREAYAARGEEGGEAQTKFGQWQLPGGSNYRELLLTLPDKGRGQIMSFDEWLDAKGVDPVNDEDVLADLRDRYSKDMRSQGDTAFRSSHWNQPNILAHVRFNERQDADGKRVLFIEEIQSDWAQKGKREGFKVANPTQEDAKRWFDIADENWSKMDAEMRQSYLDEMKESREWQRHNVPAAPFVQKTEAWVALALKRMIAYAAQNGFDRVAWTTGEQQAARYDLSQHIDRIHYESTADGNYEVIAFKKGAQSDATGDEAFHEDEIPLSRVEEVLGKEIAQKIKDGVGEHIGGAYRGWRELKGVDLKVGGEGMRAFYDKIVPNVANDVLKKLGGGKVGEVRGLIPRGIEKQNYEGPILTKSQVADLIDSDESLRWTAAVRMQLQEVLTAMDRGQPFKAAIERNGSYTLAEAVGGRMDQESSRSEPQPGFDITPALRERAMHGMPLFKKGAGSTASDTARFASELRDSISSIVSGWKNGPTAVHVHSDPSTLPKHIFDFGVEKGVITKDANFLQGLYDQPANKNWPNGTGAVHLLADAIASEAQRKNVKPLEYGQFVLFHEVLGHHGLRGMLGRDYTPVMRQVWMSNPKVRAEAKRQMREFGYGQDLATEEALADLAGKRVPINGLKRIVTRIQQWLRENGMGKLADWLETLTQAETLTLLANARAFVEHGKQAVEPHFYTEQLKPAFAQDLLSSYSNQSDAFPSGAPRDEREYLDADEYAKTLRNTYFGGDRRLNSRITPQTAAIPPVGTWRMDKRVGSDGREIEQLVELPVDNLEITEDTGPEKWADVRRYAQWLLDGKEAPPINVVQDTAGRLKVSDHRRLLAAKAVGQKTIKAWVSWIATSDRKEYGGPVGLTYELASKGAELVPVAPARESAKIFKDDARALERIRSELPQELLRAYSNQEILDKEKAESEAAKSEQEKQKEPKKRLGSRLKAEQVDLFNPQGGLFSRSKLRRNPQTETEAFKRWFGKSKVVDEDGKPKVVYHGTNADFEKFDHNFAYSGEGASQTGSGFYFTDNPDSASRYALIARDGIGHVMPMYLSLQNPLHIDFRKGEVHGADIELTAAQVRKIIMAAPNIRSREDSPLLNFGDIGYEGFNKVLGEAIRSYVGGSNIAALRNDFFGGDQGAWLRAFSAATGYDSAYAKTDNGDTHYVAWFPEQIKSAIGNRGTFDPADPRVVFSRVGQATGSRLRRGPLTTYRQHVGRLVDRFDQLLEPIRKLENIDQYLDWRNLAQGKIASFDELAKGIRAVFRPASADDKLAVFDYLTTAGATTEAISDPKLKEQAEFIKGKINEVGDALVERGLIPEESRELHRDAYLPQIYLRHLLDEPTWKAMGAGKKVSNMGYAKPRKLEWSKDEDGKVKLVDRETGVPLTDEDALRLGPITDPGYLAAQAIAKPARDMALLDFLQQISTKDQWIMPGTVARWKNRNVSVFWLQQEADRLRRMAEHYADTQAAELRDIAKRMDAAAEQAFAQQDLFKKNEPKHVKDYRQMPTGARYGALRGVWVRKEIYDDLQGVSDFIPTDPGFVGSLLGFGGVGTKITQIFKLNKVALNLPSQARNFVSNMVLLQLSGVPLHSIPKLMYQAANEIIKDGKHWQAVKRRGLTASTFSASELYHFKTELLDLMKEQGQLGVLGQIHRIAARVAELGGKGYQFVEAVGKTMKVIDEMDRLGHDEATAAREANKALFDYSQVRKGVRYARNHPFGIPFLTFQTKVAPRLLEVALLHPQRFLPWAGLMYGMSYLLGAMWDADQDDLDKLKEAMPEWIRKAGHTLILPWKDEQGRWQVIDIGYFFPWTQYLEGFQALARGEPLEALKSPGLMPGGPILEAIIAVKTGRDSFTGREILNPGDPPSVQAAALVNYMWSMMMPSMFTDRGVISPFSDTGLGGGKVVEAMTGKTNRFGDPASNMGQAMLRLFGVNITPVNPEQSRAMNQLLMKQDTERVLQRLNSRKFTERGLSDEQKKDLDKQYTDESKRRAEKLKQYSKDSEIPYNLTREQARRGVIDAIPKAVENAVRDAAQ